MRKAKRSLRIEPNEPEEGIVVAEEEIKEEIIDSMLDQVQLKESSHYALLRNLLLKMPYEAVVTLEKRNLKFVIIEKGDRAITEHIKNNVRRKESWILLIVDEEMKRHSRPDQESIIAEELAHCFLKHKDVDNECVRNTGDYRKDYLHELDAAAQMKKWEIRYVNSKELESGEG